MLIIDRFEGDWAVIEFGRKTFPLPRLLLPADAREGDAINIEVTVDRKTTASRQESISKLADRLFED